MGNPLCGIPGLAGRRSVAVAGGECGPERFPVPRVLRSGFGFRDSGFGFRISVFGFQVSGFGLRVSGFGFRVSGFGRMVPGVLLSGFGYRVSVLGSRVSDSRFQVSGVGLRVEITSELRRRPPNRACPGSPARPWWRYKTNLVQTERPGCQLKTCSK